MASVVTLTCTILTVFIAMRTVHAAKNLDLDLGFNGNGDDDFMSSLGSMVDSLAGAFEDGKECKYSCPNAKQVTKPRKDHVPTSNGCGSYGMVLNTEKLPKMTKCCDSHDICYDTCNTNKESCDRIFKQCLEVMCSDLAGSLSREEFEGCEATAELMYQGTVALGCGSFKEGQKNACECVNKTSKNARAKQTEKSQTFKNGEL
ncbi:group XIIA secretory phospholipase A2-like [Pecten maximus]|uniref:group XIIA secretory phospholipase A2-like n=1 Tax=Pecten maximus TaxID=6579 RepID=UPI0014587D8A|nr:group XIIA secretory phospholipase A2-like [Pecten maximus]